MASETSFRNCAWTLAAALVLLGVASAARGQNAGDAPPDSDDPRAAFDAMLKQTRDLGPWERQAQLNEEAASLFFQRQGWTSEPDQFARQIIRDVDRIPPWQFRERNDVFLNGLQNRYGLSENQKTELNRQMQMESLRLTLSHFKDVAPITMEILKTRAANEPFTPEQVARWSQAIRPVMDDGLASLDRISTSMAEGMSPEQRRRLDVDVKALRRRHRDLVRAVDRWQRGEWDPTQWGLDNDPVHAGMIARLKAERAAGEAIRAAMEAPPRVATPPIHPEDESSWERYVREYCAVFDFDGAQKKSARAILAEQTARAANFRRAHADRIARLEAVIQRETDLTRKTDLSKELRSELAPIGDMFEELKTRLDGLLTTEQRKRSPAARGGEASPTGGASQSH